MSIARRFNRELARRTRMIMNWNKNAKKKIHVQKKNSNTLPSTTELIYSRIYLSQSEFLVLLIFATFKFVSRKP